jgi:hypothetical protein
VLLDPAAAGHLPDQGPVQSAVGGVVDVLDAGTTKLRSARKNHPSDGEMAHSQVRTEEIATSKIDIPVAMKYR